MQHYTADKLPEFVGKWRDNTYLVFSCSYICL